MSINFVLSILLSYIIALLAIAFFTLLERKALAYFQLRKGPNKVSIAGLPQPFADAIKLFTKEQSLPTYSNKLPFLIAPAIALTLALILWSLYPYTTPPYFVKFGILAFLCVSRLNVYSTLTAGWASNSKYALLGALRGVAQTISYEVRIALILLSPLITLLSFNFSTFSHKFIYPVAILTPVLFYLWFITTLAETNRTPFDLAEGESELVSGFNIEYRAGIFALIFIGEYIRILIIRILTTAIFLPTYATTYLTLEATIKSSALAFLFLWIRGTLPRIRYDQLISLTWKSLLPISLAILIILATLFLWYCAGIKRIALMLLNMGFPSPNIYNNLSWSCTT